MILISLNLGPKNLSRPVFISPKNLSISLFHLSKHVSLFFLWCDCFFLSSNGAAIPCYPLKWFSTDFFSPLPYGVAAPLYLSESMGLYVVNGLVVGAVRGGHATVVCSLELMLPGAFFMVRSNSLFSPN